MAGNPPSFRFAPSGIVERESTDFYAVETPRLRKMVHFLQENAPSQFFRVSELAGKFLLTESSVYRAFRARFGISPKQFLLEERLAHGATQTCRYRRHALGRRRQLRISRSRRVALRFQAEIRLFAE